MSELPVGFQERMKELLGDEYWAFEASYLEERSQGLRFSSLKLHGQEAELRHGEASGLWAVRLAQQVAKKAGFSLRPVPWVKEGFYYGSQYRPGKHPYHEAGVYYIQEPSAMAVVELLEPLPGDSVLDLCAAPGGKSSHIAARLEGRGFLLSNEIHPARAKVLSQNIERMGIRNCVVCNEEPGRLAPHFAGFFDKVVVDAPCSGEGMFRKDERAREEWSEERVRMCAARQAEILDYGAYMLKPGGRLVYSTCTFAPEENEGTIMRFLEGHENFSVEERPHYKGFTAGIPKWAGYGQITGGSFQDESQLFKLHLERTMRIMPHKLEGEGHFIAVLRKEGTGAYENYGGKNGKARYLDDRKRRDVLKEFEVFLRNTLIAPEPFLSREEYVLFGEQLYLVPEQMPDMTGLKVARPGLHMGTLKKNRFEPSHGLALTLKAEEVNAVCDLQAESPQAFNYLRGGTVVPEGDNAGWLARGKGWVLVTVDGYSLGWCKLAGGILKNHYPKGLRWN